MNPTRLDITVEPGPTGATIAVTGELDMSTADRLVTTVTDALSGDADGRLSVDLSGVGFCDSAGIRALVRLRKVADQAGLSLELLNPTPVVRRVLELSGLVDHLNVR